MEISGRGRSEPEMDITQVHTPPNSVNGSAIFHIIDDVLSFLLYMHRQIPSLLQDMSAEFDALHSEYRELSQEIAAGTEVKASFRRKHVSKMRDIKMGIRRMDKFMNSLLKVRNAIKAMVSEVPNIEGVILALGANPLRPQHIYVLNFSHGTSGSEVSDDFVRSKAVEMLSKKTIRTLISKGAGSVNYPGPYKLFVLIKAPSSFNQPLHFLPKRDFRFHKKAVPLKLLFKCRNHEEQEIAPPPSEDLIWFQCRHVIKGLAMNIMPEE